MVCWAISQFCATDPGAQVEIVSAGGIRLLVFLLGHDTVDDLSKTTTVHLENGKSSLQSSSLCTTSQNSRDNEDPETKAKLKAAAACALWKLAQNNIQNSKRITDTRALLCFARLIQFENDENDLQYNCVMAVMEIARAAEHDAELRKAAFKPNSPAAKAVLEQLLRVIENGHPELQVCEVFVNFLLPSLLLEFILVV
jgi:hypothetical protein